MSQYRTIHPSLRKDIQDLSELIHQILFVHNNRATFVEIDLALLRKHYDVTQWYQQTRVVNLYRLCRAVWESDLVFGWFASWHTLFPIMIARVLRRPTVLVVGGYDTAKLPHIGYGNFGNPWKKWASLIPIRLANVLIVNSNYIRQEVISNAGAVPDRIRVIYHGFPIDTGPSPDDDRQMLVISVGNVDRDNRHRKGHELFVRAASRLPDIDFVLIGRWLDDTINQLRQIAPRNVTFAGQVSDRELNDYYRRASVYVQASLHEGFGMAVAEAMLNGCIPVVSTAGALPEVVGNDAFLVSPLDEKSLAEAIRLALSAGPQIRRKVRERIINLFSLEKRGLLLKETIEETINAYS